MLSMRGTHSSERHGSVTCLAAPVLFVLSAPETVHATHVRCVLAESARALHPQAAEIARKSEEEALALASAAKQEVRMLAGRWRAAEEEIAMKMAGQRQSMQEEWEKTRDEQQRRLEAERQAGEELRQLRERLARLEAQEAKLQEELQTAQQVPTGLAVFLAHTLHIRPARDALPETPCQGRPRFRGLRVVAC